MAIGAVHDAMYFVEVRANAPTTMARTRKL